MRALEILAAAADTIRQRAAERDMPDGERSMGRAVRAFNALYGDEMRRNGGLMSEVMGWRFMELLKIARAKAADSAATEAEAIAAAERAARLMDEHGLTIEDVTGDDAERPEVFAGIRLTGRWAACNPFIAGALAEFCGVETYRLVRTRGRRVSTVVQWVGYAADVDLAQYLYDAIHRAVMAESRAYQPFVGRYYSAAIVAKMRDDFAVAMTHRIAERIREMTEARRSVATETGFALVAIKDGAIAELLASLNIKPARRRPARRVDAYAAHAGRAAGDRVSLARPVTGQSASVLAIAAQ